MLQIQNFSPDFKRKFQSSDKPCFRLIKDIILRWHQSHSIFSTFIPFEAKDLFPLFYYYLRILPYRSLICSGNSNAVLLSPSFKFILPSLFKVDSQIKISGPDNLFIQSPFEKDCERFKCCIISLGISLTGEMVSTAHPGYVIFEEGQQFKPD